MSIFTDYTNNGPQRTVTVTLIAAALTSALLFGLLLMSTGASASPRFTRIGVADGLSGHTVTSILQDSRGFMWFGTGNSGLNRYDGVDFTVYKHDANDSTTISTNNIYSLFEDSSGTLWVGTQRGGINRYDRTSDSFTRMFDGSDGGPAIINTNINKIFEDSRGLLWFSGSKGLDCYDPRTGEIKTFAHDPNNPGTISTPSTSTLYEDGKGHLWIGTTHGLNRLDPDTGTVVRFEYGEDVTVPLYSSIVPVGDGTFWLSSYGGGLHRFDPETGTYTIYSHDPDDPHSLPENKVGYLAYDNAGTLWLGTGSGLCSYDAETGWFTRYPHDLDDPASISTDLIWPLYVDSTGILWIGTVLGGINKLVTPKTVYDYHPLGSGALSAIKQGEIIRFFEDSHRRFWIGSRNSIIMTGSNLENPRKIEIIATGDITSGSYPINCFFEDVEGHIWAGLGRNNGIKLFDERTGVFISPINIDTGMTSDMQDINENTDGNLWISTNQGFSIFDPRSKRIVYSTTGKAADTLFANMSFKTSLFDGHGSFWVGNGKDLT